MKIHELRSYAASVAERVAAILCLALCGSVFGKAQTPQTGPLMFVQAIPLDAHGPLNHMIVDRLNDRAFIAAAGRGTVEVVDLKTAKTVASIAGPGKPGELIYFKKCDCVAYGTSSGALRILNPNTLKVDAEFTLNGTVEAVALDPQNELVYVARDVAHDVAAGKSFSRISFIDLMARTNEGEIKIEGERLGQMALEHHGPRGYVNNSSRNEVVVLDLSERKVVDTWQLGVAADNVALALDEADHRLFVGSHRPNTLLVIDTRTGATVAHLSTVGNVEDIAYDSTLKRLYLSGSEGFIDVFQQADPDHYRRIARVATSAGAGTSKWVPEQSRLYVEVPSQKASEGGRLLVYEAVK